MGFDKDSWKSQIAAYFKSHAPQLRQAGTDALYGLVMAGVLLPAISAFLDRGCLSDDARVVHPVGEY